jgi:aquaporin Z
MPGEDHAQEEQHASDAGRRYLIRFDEDTLRSRPLWIRVITEFAGTFLLVTVAAGAGVINDYAGGHPVSRAAAVIAPGALVMALIYAWGPLSGLHINPAVTLAFLGRRVFPMGWVIPYWAAQFAGAITAALLLQALFGHASAGGTYPIARPGGDWRAFVMEILLTATLVSVILNTATGHRSIGHNAAIAGGASMNPARTLGPDIAGADFAGWWVYVLGDAIGAVIAVMLIGLVRGMPNRAERESAEGSGLSG